jgi:G3E family GTPase
MLAAMFLADSALRHRLRLDGIVTIVDAANYRAHAGQEGHADEQIAYADAVVLNKSDLVSAEELSSLLAALRRLNGQARTFVTSQARAPIDELLNLGGFDFARVENGVAGCRDRDRPAGEHRHEIETVTIQCPGSLDFDRFRAWFEAFLGRHARDLFRAKGVLAVHGNDERLLIQTVHGCCRVTTGSPWHSLQRGSSLVLIGRNLPVPALQRGLLSCVVAAVETGERQRGNDSARVDVAGTEAAS